MTAGARRVALVLVLILAAACGQKAGVGGNGPTDLGVAAPTETATTLPLAPVSAAPVAESATAPTTLGVAPAPGGSPARPGPAKSTPAVGRAPAPSSSAPGTGPPGTAVAAGPPETQSTGPKGPVAPGPPSPAASPGDSNGVTDTEIVIGVHGPLTGAAPIPQDTLNKAMGLYWKFIAERGGVFGRNVRVIFRDDQYNPTRALQVCREMVEQEKVFLLAGVGADQVAPCARYASQVKVPYFAAGSGEEGLTGLETYFAVSMTFPAQAPMLAALVKKAGKTKVGIVVVNTVNYDDSFKAFDAAARKAGLQVVRASRINKNASQAETLAEANALRTAGAEAVVFLASPLVFVNLAHSAQGQAYNPLWVGPGLSNGINLVAEFGCPSIGAARMLSPFPQLDVIDRFDADYRVTYRKHNDNAEPDDIGLLVWGLDKTLKLFFDATGRELTRSRFLATVTSGREFVSGILPPLRYGPGLRFGASQAHLLEADCENRRYRTLATFFSSL